jgi:hypothetical protein
LALFCRLSHFPNPKSFPLIHPIIYSILLYIEYFHI